MVVAREEPGGAQPVGKTHLNISISKKRGGLLRRCLATAALSSATREHPEASSHPRLRGPVETPAPISPASPPGISSPTPPYLACSSPPPSQQRELQNSATTDPLPSTAERVSARTSSAHTPEGCCCTAP
ncbi:hypothetical protein AXF42_Ash021809 [Apostasia shenzhenica]|uniref:Uncharacterized protein n=1 Tax=Apostasia shenzhenica TaxID=1088818 RepID=A0A2H9ZVN4_9ASPA|nr:hypothetical protein AXF42_Ash021809 [Apostasia shenzhenica]